MNMISELYASFWSSFIYIVIRWFRVTLWSVDKEIHHQNIPLLPLRPWSTGYTFCQQPCGWLKNCYVSLLFVLPTGRGVGWRLCEIHALSRLVNISDATEMKVISSLTLPLCVVEGFWNSHNTSKRSWMSATRFNTHICVYSSIIFSWPSDWADCI